MKEIVNLLINILFIPIPLPINFFDVPLYYNFFGLIVIFFCIYTVGLIIRKLYGGAGD